MLKKGYLFVRDSFIEGCLADLVFKRPNIEGNKETWVEAKFTDLGLSNKDFLREFGEYFITYMKKNPNDKFNLLLFIKHCASPQKWKKVFDETKGHVKEVKEFYDDIEKNLTGDNLELFLSFEFNDFNYFINEVEIIEGNYESLSQQMERIGQAFSVNNAYLEEDVNIEQKPEILTGNLVKVINYPTQLWTSKLKLATSTEDLWAHSLEQGLCYHGDSIYSLEKPTSDKYIDLSTSQQITIESLEEVARNKILSFLIKGLIIRKGFGLGLRYDGEYQCLYFPLDANSGDKLDKRKVLKAYYKEGKLNFVKHDAIRVEIINIEGEIYVSFELLLIFTSDGKTIITGNSAKALHHKFTLRFTFNDTERSKLLHWISLFKLRDKTLTLSNGLSFSDPITLKMNVSYNGGVTFSEDISKFMGETDDEP